MYIATPVSLTGPFLAPCISLPTDRYVSKVGRQQSPRFTSATVQIAILNTGCDEKTLAEYKLGKTERYNQYKRC